LEVEDHGEAGTQRARDEVGRERERREAAHRFHGRLVEETVGRRLGDLYARHDAVGLDHDVELDGAGQASPAGHERIAQILVDTPSPLREV
jgi:hypothetical protein